MRAHMRGKMVSVTKLGPKILDQVIQMLLKGLKGPRLADHRLLRQCRGIPITFCMSRAECRSDHETRASIAMAMPHQLENPYYWDWIDRHGVTRQ